MFRTRLHAFCVVLVSKEELQKTKDFFSGYKEMETSHLGFLYIMAAQIPTHLPPSLRYTRSIRPIFCVFVVFSFTLICFIISLLIFLLSLVFTPFRKAVAELAESAPCRSRLYVLARPDHGNISQLKTFSSPDFPFICPSRMRAAVVVVIPIPSPRNRIAFLAVFVFCFNFRFF